MKPRDYQQNAINDLYQWFRQNSTGHPCMVLPTGAGKSVIIAALCRDALTSWPETRILMLAHSRELVGQNAERMRSMWPNAPLGIYSAGLNKRQLGEPITFASVQSVAKKAKEIGHIDLIFIDECHAINHKQTGQYRDLIADLTEINPALRIIGCTATPYRLGHGFIDEGEDAIFSDLLYSVTITDLLSKGHLAPLRSKHTAIEYDTSTVGIRGGDYVVSELEKLVDTDEYNHAVVEEMMRRASDRKAWLIFAVGVSHAQHISDLLSEKGVSSACVHGGTPSAQRKQTLSDFKAGTVRALVNVGVLTTGFDEPRIDMIAMLRPTASTGLYVQMAGRGLRTHPEKQDCLVLDFAGNVSTHGPITNPKPPNAPKKKKGEAEEKPTKVCPKCEEVLSRNAKECPCGHDFGEEMKQEELKLLKLHNDDILAKEEAKAMLVARWQWKVHTSKTSGKEMLAVSYYSARLLDDPVTEYFAVTHEGYAGDKANRQIKAIAENANGNAVVAPSRIEPQDMLAFVSSISRMQPPAEIQYQREGKYHRVTKRTWKNGKSV